MKKIILILVAAASLMACTKEGKQGEPGTNGTNGTNGNANVIATQNVATNSGDWGTSAGAYYVQLSVNGLNQAIFDKGAVLVYEQNGSIWNALPYTYGNLARTFTFELNKVTIFYQNQSGTTANPGNKTFRIVLVSASNRLINIDWTNYNEVKGALNLKD